MHMSQSNERFQVSINTLRAIYTPFAWLQVLLARRKEIRTQWAGESDKEIRVVGKGECAVCAVYKCVSVYN